MDMGNTLSEIPGWNTRANQQVDALLARAGIRRDANLDYTCGIFDSDDRLIATGSTFGNTLRCFAVDSSHRGEGLLNQVVTHLMQRQAERGIFHLFVYTKCESARMFQDLGFYEIARVEGGVSFLENRADGFRGYCARLARTRREGTSAAIVMNANPFTLGHRYLAEQAAGKYDTVHLFVLSEDASLVPFSVRWQLAQEGVADLPNVVLHESGPYLISAATFPSYFFPDQEAEIRCHARLDLTLFLSIAQALGVTARYVGEEPNSVVTGLYNEVMARQLPRAGVACVVVPRKCADGRLISAGTVRQAIHDGHMEEIRAMVPQSTWRFFHSPQAAPVIKAICSSASVIHY